VAAASYHFALGLALQTEGKLDEAVASYQRALALNPENADAHSNLGSALAAQGRVVEAMTHYLQVLTLDPAHAHAYNNVGNLLHANGKWDEAVACYLKALSCKPDFADAAHNLGIVLQAQGNLEAAVACHQRALELKPDFAEARFSEGLAQLSQGDFANGWNNYEARWQTKRHQRWARSYSQPLWTGERLQEGRLLIWSEQGVGDEIMFAGLLPEVIRTGNRCVLDCDARLKPLFARSFPDVEVISDKDAVHRPELGITAHIPGGSLPGQFRKNHAAFLAGTPSYLKADPVQRERFRAQYGNGKRRIGLAWCTLNPETGRMRSIELSLLKPLFELPDTRWVSLQYGDHKALANQAAAVRAPLLIDPSVNQLLDIDVFAAQIAAMDLVVTIDNSTAHLAGALGVPVCLLLPFAADWRWLRGGDKSPWYPSMRVFRQPKPGDWQSVIENVRLTYEDLPSNLFLDGFESTSAQAHGR
jgi:Flp pilus assembly protein TadD